MTSDAGLILGIGIDEELTFALAPYLPAQRIMPDDFVTPVVRMSLIEGAQPDTLRAGIREYLRQLPPTTRRRLRAISISSIGVIEYGAGQVTTCRRPGWPETGYPIDFEKLIAGEVRGVPVYLHNDATCAAIGEYYADCNRAFRAPFTAGNGVARAGYEQIFCFVRIGGGVNAGFLINGQPWRGARHPEFGHIHPRRAQWRDRKGRLHVDRFGGCCIAHRDCFEGLISRKAHDMRRHSMRGRPHGAFMTDYVAQMCAMLVLTLAPQRIALGGSSIVGSRALIDFDNVRLLLESMVGMGSQSYPIRLDQASNALLYKAQGGPDANLVGALNWARSALCLKGVTHEF